MDLLDVMEAKKNIDAESLLADLSIETAEYLKSEEFKRFINVLRKDAGLLDEGPPKFDKVAFERVRQRLKSGI